MGVKMKQQHFNKTTQEAHLELKTFKKFLAKKNDYLDAVEKNKEKIYTLQKKNRRKRELLV
jgi:hypothetical protein